MISREGDTAAVGRIRAQVVDTLPAGTLAVLQQFVTRDNIASALLTAGATDEFDLLSIDVDQNTYWVWDGLRALRPRVVVVEYNAAWPASVDWMVRYDPAAIWDGTLACGANLKAFENLGRELGYTLVGANLVGTNAFFVRHDLTGDQFVGPFTAERFYEPPRYFMSRLDGYRPGYSGFRQMAAKEAGGR